MALDHSARTRERTARTLFALEQLVNDLTTRMATTEATLATAVTNIASNTASISAINTTIANLTLDSLIDVDAASPSNGDGLTFNAGSGKWETGASSSTPEVEMGTGVPSGLPATTLVYLDTTGKRIYWRINTTVGTGAQWDYADGTGTYTEP